MRKVAIIGVGMTPFGQLWDRSLISLAVEAGAKAIHDAGITHKDVGVLYGGTMSSGLFSGQEHLASMFADHSGFDHIPSVRVEAACASGGLALRQAYIDVASGAHDIAVVGGVEKMTDLGIYPVTKVLSTAADAERESSLGVTFPGIYAMMARLHMHKYHTTEEQLAMVAVKNHAHAIHNPHAQFRRAITVDQVMGSVKIADPLKLLDASPVSDGGAALVLADEKTARSQSDTPVWIAGSGHATDTIALHDREDMLSMRSTVYAARDAFRQAGLSPKDIGMAELHDCFTIAELLALEDLGFVDRGASGSFIEQGQAHIGGSLPINPSGGLKAKGHPVGASGIAQAIESVLQLRGDAGLRNTGAEIALTQNVGGSGGTAVVHIFRR
ncbi:MAG: thiolase domain-containing protein [DPANN group archaeon]|nr:thiolase domain-containing protein [DPANN group archaeon]